jgi:hypothetical protein
MKDITVLLYWTNMREITSYWFNVQKRANFKQLFCVSADSLLYFTIETKQEIIKIF